MKKIFAVILAVVILTTTLVSCEESIQDGEWSQTCAWVGCADNDAFYFGALNRNLLSLGNEKNLPVYKFESMTELKYFKTNFSDDFFFGETYDDKQSFEKALHGVDDRYFRKYSMYLVYVESGSGSYQYEINDVVVDGENFCIYVKQANTPEVVTDDMAGWFLLLTLPKNVGSDCTVFDAQMIN